MDPKRILIVCYLSSPDRGGGASVFTDLAVGLAERGHSVELRTAYPFYPEWKDKSGNNGRRIRTETHHGVTVRRFGLFIPRDPSSLVQRLVYEGSFLCSLLRRPDTREFDCVVAYAPLVGGVAFSAIAAGLSRRPLWINVQDLSAEAAAAAGIAGGGVSSRLAAMQNALYRRADLVTSIAPEMVDHLASSIDDRPIELFPNWLHGTMREAIATAQHKGPRADGPVRLLYAGNVGQKQQLPALLDAAARTDLEFEFRIHGSGSGMDDVRDWHAEIRDSRFDIGDFLDEPGFAEALTHADRFVVSEAESAGPAFIPSKLIPAFEAGTPVLAVCEATSPMAGELDACGAGSHHRWTDIADALAEAAKMVVEPEQDEMIERCRSRALHYGRDRSIDQAETFIAGLVADAAAVASSNRPGAASDDLAVV